jgi:5-methylcytosine-specific restriction protein A
MAPWPYNSDAWKRLRKLKLAASPLCEVCALRGLVVLANTVDHVHAIRDGGLAFPALDGLMSMCHACHNQKTVALEREGGKGVGIKGCDERGLPIDVSHPFWGITPSKDCSLSAKERRGPRKQT